MLIIIGLVDCHLSADEYRQELVAEFGEFLVLLSIGVSRFSLRNSLVEAGFEELLAFGLGGGDHIFNHPPS